MRVAVLHNKFESYSGSENVAVAIAKIFNAPIYTTTQIVDYDGVRIFPQMSKTPSNYFHEEFKRTKIFSNLELPQEVIISSGDKAKFFKPKEWQYHVNYTHSPTRMFYDLRDRIRNSLPTSKKILFDVAGWLWRWRLEKSLSNVHKFLCNSEVVRDRMLRYWNTGAEVLYPPVDTSQYENRTDEGFFLYMSRLCPEKRIQEVIDAFEKNNDNLVVIGKDEGNYSDQLRNNSNIDYRGEVSEREKLDLLSRCKAVIYPPVEEDFGLVPVEAFASGKPVIGANEGFTKYQVDNSNGILVNPTSWGIMRGMEKIKQSEWNPVEIQGYAKQYDMKVFERKLKEIVEESI